MNNVLRFPPSVNMTTEQCLLSCLESVDTLQDVLVIGYDTDGDLFIRSSKMDRRDALWMAEMLRNYAQQVEVNHD